MLIAVAKARKANSQTANFDETTRNALIQPVQLLTLLPVGSFIS